MKLQFKHQKFQADAAKAVVDVFNGQPYLTSTYMMDRGNGRYQIGMEDDIDFTGWRNERIVPELSDKRILENLQKVQRIGQIKPSDKLEGHYNLTIEMETGVGKTYTYIKTMYELNRHYGWSKFIVVVPSIAIREGVYKSFQVTQEHFAEEYGKKVRFFIYNSTQLTEIDRFASDSSINVMIINSQAFNKSVDAEEKLKNGKRADKNAAIIFREMDILGEMLLSLKYLHGLDMSKTEIYHDSLKGFEEEYNQSFEGNKIHINFVDSKENELIQLADNISSIYRKCFEKSFEAFRCNKQWTNNIWFTENYSRIINIIGMEHIKMDTQISDYVLPFVIRDIFENGNGRFQQNKGEFWSLFYTYRGKIIEDIDKMRVDLPL